jgi:hypothetical protein
MKLIYFVDEYKITFIIKKKKNCLCYVEHKILNLILPDLSHLNFDIFIIFLIFIAQIRSLDLFQKVIVTFDTKF